MSAKRLKPRPLVIADDEGFENTDLFGLSEYGERLADLVCNVEDPLVTILDGPWGSGKTIFAKQWAGLMRNRGARVIYFDAFANDHHEDALIPLTAQILSALPDEKAKTKKAKLKSATLGVVKYLIPIVANPLIRAGTGGLLASSDLQGVAKDAGEALGKGAGLIIEKTLEARLEAAGDEKAIFQNFRTALEEASSILGGSDSSAALPLVFIIDELDRCRPIFAINLIERVKHLFSVTGVQFLLVAHLPQLEEAVGHCYGLELGGRAKIYLEKFYDVKVEIPENPNKLPAGEYFRHLCIELGIPSIINAGTAEPTSCFEYSARIMKTSLRTVEKICSNIALAYAIVPQDPRINDTFLIEGLCIIRHLNSELYNRICSCKNSYLYNLEARIRSDDEDGGMQWLSEMWNEVRDFFELETGSGFADVRRWMVRCWTYSDSYVDHGRYLSPEVIRCAKIIGIMSI